MPHPFTLGVEEEFQIVDPATWELRSHVSELLASSAATFGDLAKAEMHQSIVEVGTKICSGVGELAEEIIRNRRGLADAAESRRPARRGGRHASLLVLDGSGHLAGRTLQEHRRGVAAARALAAHFRPARARRHPRSVAGDRADERSAIFPAAPPRALDQLAVLDGPRHRAQTLWYGRSRLFEFIEAAKLPRGRLYLDVGTAEGASTLNDSRALWDLIDEKGIPNDSRLAYVEDRGGRHEEAAWARRLSGALEFLFDA